MLRKSLLPVGSTCRILFGESASSPGIPPGEMNAIVERAIRARITIFLFGTIRNHLCFLVHEWNNVKIYKLMYKQSRDSWRGSG